MAGGLNSVLPDAASAPLERANPLAGNPAFSSLSSAQEQLYAEAADVDPMTVLRNNIYKAQRQPDLSAQIQAAQARMDTGRAQYEAQLQNSYSPERESQLNWNALGKMGAAMMDNSGGRDQWAAGQQVYQQARGENQATLDAAGQRLGEGQYALSKDDYNTLMAQQKRQDDRTDQAMKEYTDYQKALRIAKGSIDPGELAKVMALRENAKTPEEKAYVERLIQMKYGGEQGKLMANLKPQYVFGTPEYAATAAKVQLNPSDRLKYVDAYVKDNTDAYAAIYGPAAREKIYADAHAFVSGALHNPVSEARTVDNTAVPDEVSADSTLAAAIAFRDSQPVGSEDRAIMNQEIARLKKALKAAPAAEVVRSVPLQTSAQKAGSVKTAEKTAEAEVIKTYDKNPEYATLVKLSADLDNMGELAEELKTDPNLKNAIGPWDSRMPTLFAKTGDIEAKIDNLKTLTGFNTLASMREASKTGGALGAISDKENEMLQNAIAALASLNQSDKGYKAQLQKVKDFVAASKQRYIDAFKAKYPDVDLSALSPKAPGKPEAPKAPGRPRSNAELFDTYLKEK